MWAIILQPLLLRLASHRLHGLSLHLLPLALVLVGILSLPLLIPGAILGIVSSVTTSETPVVIGLTVLLLLWLIVVPLN